MGTTVTTNLGLIKPDGDEKIQEDLPTFAGWAAQNAINCDKIDALFRATNHSYTPTWTGTGGNPTLGAGGFVEGKCLRLWPRLIIEHIRIFTGGAGFNAGSGTYNLTLRETPATEFTTFFDSVPIGKAVFYDDSSVLDCSNMVALYGVSAARVYFRPGGGGSWTNLIPVTLAQNDRMSCYFMYPTSAP